MSILSAYKERLSGEFSSRFGPKLDPLKDKAFDRWDQLSDRDQLIVLALGICTAIVLSLVTIYAPLLKSKEQAELAYTSKTAQLTWMRSVAPQLSQHSGANLPSAQGMMNEVNSRAAAFQLKLDRVQPEGPNKLRVWVQDASFDALMAWLIALQRESGIVAGSINIDAESQPGVISAKVVLQGG